LTSAIWRIMKFTIYQAIHFYFDFRVCSTELQDEQVSDTTEAK